MTGLCALWLTALLAAFARLAESVSPVVRCEPCDEGAMVLCKPLPWDCAQPVKEPGCGCCLTCPLTEGQACGVYTGRCGTGLSCQHRPGESKPLQALLEGRGVCAKVPDKKPSGSPSHERDNPEEEAKEHNGTRAAGTERPEMVHHTTAFSRDAQGGSRMPSEPNDPMMILNKLEMIQKEQVKKSQVHKVVAFPCWRNQDNNNFSLDPKRENEYGPCRREMEGVIKKFKLKNELDSGLFHIPNCDQKGFYKKKQCSPSKGRKRGHCWCVDKYGQPLPGYEGKEKLHCYNMETK